MWQTILLDLTIALKYLWSLFVQNWPTLLSFLATYVTGASGVLGWFEKPFLAIGKYIITYFFKSIVAPAVEKVIQKLEDGQLVDQYKKDIPQGNTPQRQKDEQNILTGD